MAYELFERRDVPSSEVGEMASLPGVRIYAVDETMEGVRFFRTRPGENLRIPLADWEHGPEMTHYSRLEGFLYRILIRMARLGDWGQEGDYANTFYTQGFAEDDPAFEVSFNGRVGVHFVSTEDPRLKGLAVANTEFHLRRWEGVVHDRKSRYFSNVRYVKL